MPVWQCCDEIGEERQSVRGYWEGLGGSTAPSPGVVGVGPGLGPGRAGAGAGAGTGAGRQHCAPPPSPGVEWGWGVGGAMRRQLAERPLGYIIDPSSTSTASQPFCSSQWWHQLVTRPIRYGQRRRRAPRSTGDQPGHHVPVYWLVGGGVDTHTRAVFRPCHDNNRNEAMTNPMVPINKK